MIKTLKIKTYHDTEGRQVCALDVTSSKVCVFLRTINMGTRDVCNFTDREQFRESDLGFIRPDNHCPVRHDRSKK